MNHIQIPYIAFIKRNHPIEEASAKLDDLNKTELAESPWANYEHKPIVRFAIGHAGHSILLKYQVSEKSILAVHRTTNQPVYEDSCVEFFIAFNGEEKYYNFEFNCMGTCLAGFGSGRVGRELLPVDLIKEIKVHSIIKATSADGFINWELSLMIPLTVFCRHRLTFMEGQYCKMNFYKCGDHLPEPHFLAWNNIVSPDPDFHLPEFFGTGLFGLIPETVFI
ncbi:MAG: hypothetical protein H7096_00750 [Flavobacterium sp.]|nr:hypothetical protein [Pedobacter sp.]